MVEFSRSNGVAVLLSGRGETLKLNVYNIAIVPHGLLWQPYLSIFWL